MITDASEHLNVDARHLQAIDRECTSDRVTRSADRKRVAFEVRGAKAMVEADEILLAAGKTPNTGGLALPQAGVAVDAKQAIVVNAFLQPPPHTSTPSAMWST